MFTKLSSLILISQISISPLGDDLDTSPITISKLGYT